MCAGDTHFPLRAVPQGYSSHRAVRRQCRQLTPRPMVWPEHQDRGLCGSRSVERALERSELVSDALILDTNPRRAWAPGSSAHHAAQAQISTAKPESTRDTETTVLRGQAGCAVSIRASIPWRWPAKTAKNSVCSRGLRQDPGLNNTIPQMPRIQAKITQHMKNQGN